MDVLLSNCAPRGIVSLILSARRGAVIGHGSPFPFGVFGRSSRRKKRLGIFVLLSRTRLHGPRSASFRPAPGGEPRAGGGGGPPPRPRAPPPPRARISTPKKEVSEILAVTHPWR